MEWRGGAWHLLAPESSLNDPLLILPIPVQALLDAAAADDAVAQVLLAKNNPVLAKLVQDSEAKGLKAGRITAILDLCEVLGIEVKAAQRALLPTLSLDELAVLQQALKLERRWPKPD